MSHDTQPALVLLDHHGGAVRGPSLEVVAAARRLGPVHAVWIGDLDAGAADVLGAHGVEVVHRVPDGEADVPGAIQVAAVLADLVRETGAGVTLLTSTFENKEAAALLAAALDAALVVDAVDVTAGKDGRTETVQQAFAATWTVRGAVRTAHAVVALKANAVPAEPVAEPVAVHVQEHAAVPPPAARRARVVSRSERAASTRPELTESQVVVVGGRGTEGDFSVVEQLADALGAAVGATRVATDEGWIGHEAQVGQTGVTISPALYIGLGVSGAVHHRGGMQSSGTIVAVNSDPEAPIFEIADLGIVGDIFTVVPQAVAELERRQG